jgi:hypothetical protein
MADVFLSLVLKELERTKKEALERFKAETGAEKSEELQYPELKWEIDEMTFDENTGEVYICGNLESGKLGYLAITCNMDMDTVIGIISMYTKKMNKLKTVLEATKD